MFDTLAAILPGWGEEALWMVVGFGGQALFTARIVVQWWASEKAKKSVVPASFWWLSVWGTVMLALYAFFRRDPIFLIGPILNLFLYIRNLMLMLNPNAKRRVGALLIPLAAVLLLGGGAVAFFTAQEKDILRVDASPFWLFIGFVGTSLWTLRFPVQWIIAERLGRSVLPPAFWWMTILGTVLLTAYAAYKPDPVFVLAYALSPVPAIRNLMLMRQDKPAGETADDNEIVEEPVPAGTEAR